MADGLIEEFDALPRIIGILHLVGSNAVESAANAIAAGAAANHPYQNQTGQAESAFYVVTHDKSTYGQGVAGGGELLPEIPKAENDQTAYVANASPHFIFLELGTVKMSPYPSLIPAVEAARQAFESGEGWEAQIARLAGL